MNKSEFFIKCLDRKKGLLLRSIEKAKEARDSAPGAMESASDTRRSQAEKLVSALEEELKELNKYSNGVGPFQLVYMEVNVNSAARKFLLVPEGLGGEEIDGIRLLSIDTPLGQLLKGKSADNKFDFNGQSLEILKME